MTEITTTNLLLMTNTLFVFAIAVLVYLLRRDYNTRRGVPQTTTPTRRRMLDTISVSFDRSQLTQQYLSYRNAGYKVVKSGVGEDDKVTLVMVKHIGYYPG